MDKQTKDELIVFVRIGLYILSGALVSKGVFTKDVANQFNDPMLIEAVTGLLIGAGSLVWYWFSRARKAIKEKIE